MEHVKGSTCMVNQRALKQFFLLLLSSSVLLSHIPSPPYLNAKQTSVNKNNNKKTVFGTFCMT